MIDILPLNLSNKAMVDLSQYSNRDAKIIRENDGKTPYQLLELGLSQKAFDRLTVELEGQRQAPTPKNVDKVVTNPEAQAGETAPPPAPPEQSGALTPTTVETVPLKPTPAKPKLGPTSATAKPVGNGTVTIVGPTGIPQTMSEGRARSLADRNPGKYRIL